MYHYLPQVYNLAPSTLSLAISRPISLSYQPGITKWCLFLTQYNTCFQQSIADHSLALEGTERRGAMTRRAIL
ncbi:hypothetical protein E2C01_087946 [Portunus trituberculatus]|uniref:Uncharacterized protein n=1 Tax=Portunus trituberculatus TaxID=210409 RepID=A0A5B7JFE9_PORTR|nr:hypothetical protein [Portunus trituberculatus]